MSEVELNTRIMQIAGWETCSSPIEGEVSHRLFLGYTQKLGVEKYMTRILLPDGFAFGSEIKSMDSYYRSETLTQTYRFTDDPEPQGILAQVNQAIADQESAYIAKRSD